MTTTFFYTDVIDIFTRVNGQLDCRIHFQLTTECTMEDGFSKITYTFTNFLDSTTRIIYLMVEDQVFPFDTGINPGSIGTVQFSRNGTCLPATGTVYLESETQGFEFGTLCTAVLKTTVPTS